MTREEAYTELLSRLELDLANHIDYCIGEKPLRALLGAFKNNDPLPIQYCNECFLEIHEVDCADKPEAP